MPAKRGTSTERVEDEGVGAQFNPGDKVPFDPPAERKGEVNPDRVTFVTAFNQAAGITDSGVVLDHVESPCDHVMEVSN